MDAIEQSTVLIHLAEFYMNINETCEDKLLQFPAEDNYATPTFGTAFGGDGAPGAGLSYLVSFINTGRRIASSFENYLVFGGNVAVNSIVCHLFVRKFIHDMNSLVNETH